jgi:glutamate synthase (NADPH/NADH) large chain
MTGGTAIILGETGTNFGAGMTGGMAFILDEGDAFPARANPESIVWQRLASAHWEARLKALIAEHAVATDSRWANTILDDWARYAPLFWQVCPREMLSRLEHPLDDSPALEAAE